MSTAYTTFVRPIMEYANAVWDPHQHYLIGNIEMVQWQAARWVKQDYRLTSSEKIFNGLLYVNTKSTLD